MVARKLALFLVCLLGMAVGSASAQSEARIRVVLPSIEHDENALKWLIEQSPSADLKKQWKKLKSDVINAFTQGVDLSKPIEVDIVFRKDDMAYEFRVPLAKLNGPDGFIEFMEGLGYKVKPVVPGVLTFFEIAEKGKKPVYLRFDKDYAWVSPLKAAVPPNPPAATGDMEPLLGLKKDVVADLKNDAEGLEGRRENFRELRKQFEALIKFHRNEDKNAFELRKLALTQQLDEAERFVVESETFQVNWITSISEASPTGRGEISLTALAGTDLLKSLQEFAVKPSYFANVQLHPAPLVVGKLTFPLDALRVQHVKDFYKAVRPTLETEIDARAGKTDAQKTATKQAMNKFLDMLDAGASLGVVDSFIDTHAVEPGKNVMVCGIRAADGKVADEIIKLLPAIKAEWQVKPHSEHGGVSIHELTVPKARLESFQRIFAGETALYVGTSKDAVWGAAGVDALKHLATAIYQVAQPAPEKVDPVVISYQVQVAKLVTLLEILQKEAPALNAPKTKEQIKEQKDIEKYRKLAQDAMGDCNSLLRGELRRTDNKIEGFLELNECVLRYIGSMIADGVKVTLQ